MSNANEAAKIVVDGEVLKGRVLRPYIKNDTLAGAVLSFDGYAETALLHIRQMTGSGVKTRLADMKVGDSLLVRLMVSDTDGKRKIWASENGIGHAQAVAAFDEQPEQFSNLRGVVFSLTKHGAFIEISEGPFAGQRGLLRPEPSQGNIRLGAYTKHRRGDLVTLDVAEARMSDDKLLLRVENVRGRAA